MVFMMGREDEIIYLKNKEIMLVKTSTSMIAPSDLKVYDFERLVLEICEIERIDLDDINKKLRFRKVVNIKKALILLIDRYCEVTPKKIVQRLNISESMISKIKSGVSKCTTEVEEIMKRWERHVNGRI